MAFQDFTCPYCHVTLHLKPQRWNMRSCPCGILSVDYEECYTRCVGCIPLEVSKELPNYINIPIVLPDFYKDWVETNVPVEDIKTVPHPQLTIICGFNPSKFWNIKKIVDSYFNLGDNLEFGSVQDDTVLGERVKMVSVTSLHLQECFLKIINMFISPIKHSRTTPPHAILCSLRARVLTNDDEQEKVITDLEKLQIKQCS